MKILSVCMIAYNQEKYICEAIEGVINQITDFEIELIIGEDYSTDATRTICQKYYERYPQLINILPSEMNLGMTKNFVRTLKACSGKYIAICEGDDYWTDPYKLQKQVDYLELNESIVFCVHRYKRFICNEKTYAADLYTELFLNKNGIVIDKSIFSKYWLTQPLTAVIRTDCLSKVLFLNSRFNFFRDIHLFYLLLNMGNGYCMNFIGGVYNIHDSGIQGGLSNKQQIIANFNVIKELYLYCPDATLELMLINFVNGMIRNTKSLSPILLIILLDVSLSAKIKLFHKFIKIVMNKIIHLRLCL